MKKNNYNKRVMAIVLSVLMVMIGLPFQTQATSLNWSQLANKPSSEDWIYGNLNSSKSVYVEGMSVPQRLELSGIQTTSGSAIHYVDFEYQFTKNGKYAYDFITGWDQAKETANDLVNQNWNDSWIGELDNEVDVVIPPSPGSTNASSKESAYESEYGTRTLRIYSNKPISNPQVNINSNLSGSVTKDSTMGFTVSWEGDADEVIILYASHIALGNDSDMGWGAGMGASGIAGSPYHNYVIGSSEWSGSSRRDNQLQISEQIEISGIKWNDSDKDGVMDKGEEKIEGFEIWADLNDDGIKGEDEPSTFTDENGRYSLYLTADKGLKKVKIYEVQKNGYIQTYPTSGYHELSINKKDDAFTGVDFGNFKKNPKIEITKAVTPLTMPEPGGEFTYTFVVENIGNVPVTLIEVSDDKLGSITLPSDVYLEPGESTAVMTVKATHTDDGVYKNIVTAKAKDSDNKVVTDTDKATVTITDTEPAISVTKTASPTSLPKGGGEFTYTYVVTNTGTVPVTLKSVVDDKLGTITLPADVDLEPGESTVQMTITHTYTEPGEVTNIVTAKAVDDDNNEAAATDEATIRVLESDSSITVTKTASPTTLPEPGGEFTYTYRITNNGKIPVTILNVHDDVIGDITLPEDTSLEPNEYLELTGKYTYTDDGTYKNIVDVTAIDSNEKTITASTSAVVTVTDTKPTISVIKTASPASLPVPGGEFTYTFVVKNTGSVPVTLKSVVDNVLGEIDLPEDVELSPGESTTEMIVKKTHTNVGTYFNTVTATAVDDDNNVAVDTDEASVKVTEVFVPEYKLSITKEADVTEYDAINDVINYIIQVRNSGNAELTEVTVIDPLLLTLTGPVGDMDEDGKLDVEETWTYTGSYTVVQKDIDAGHVINTATADSNETEEVSDSVTVDYDEPGNPPTDNSRYRLTIEKEADVDEYSEVGDVINYTITLENAGNRPLTGVKVTDPLLGSLDGPEGDTDNDNMLDVNETWVYTGEYTVTEADIENGSIKNTATADSNETNSVDDSVTVTKTEDETELIPEPETPLGVPEEIIEEAPVPQATLPDTGDFLNDTMLLLAGSLMITSGIALNKKKKSKIQD